MDVFSFAVLCHEMLTGEVPWRHLAGPMQARAVKGRVKEQPCSHMHTRPANLAVSAHFDESFPGDNPPTA